MSNDRVGPIGFWKFVIVVTVGLTIVQKFLIRDPSFQFLKGVPVFAVAIVLWGAYRYFFKPIRILEMVSTKTQSNRETSREEIFSEPAPREARLQRVLTAEDLRRLHAPKNKKAARAQKIANATVKTPTATSATISKNKVAITPVSAVRLSPVAVHQPKTTFVRVRKKQIRYKTQREKTVRLKRAPARFDPNHL